MGGGGGEGLPAYEVAGAGAGDRGRQRPGRRRRGHEATMGGGGGFVWEREKYSKNRAAEQGNGPVACSLVGFWTGLGWPVLIYCERKTLLAG